MKASGNTILITGGGSGIGEALAHRFHDAGNTVIIAGRRRDALDKAAGGRERIHTRTLDMADARSIAAFGEALVADYPTLNVVIHNAGIMKIEDAGAQRNLADAEATVITNLLGPIRLTNALIEHLKAQADAALVTVTSGLAFVPLVDAAVYSATKAAIHSWTVSLRDALKGRVEVIELAPPGVQTGLTPNQETRPGYLPLEDFADEAFALFQQQPTPSEILVERVRPLRGAERAGKFEETFAGLNESARKARAAQG